MRFGCGFRSERTLVKEEPISSKQPPNVSSSNKRGEDEDLGQTAQRRDRDLIREAQGDLQLSRERGVGVIPPPPPGPSNTTVPKPIPVKTTSSTADALSDTWHKAAAQVLSNLSASERHRMSLGMKPEFRQIPLSPRLMNWFLTLFGASFAMAVTWHGYRDYLKLCSLRERCIAIAMGVKRSTGSIVEARIVFHGSPTSFRCEAG